MLVSDRKPVYFIGIVRFFYPFLSIIWFFLSATLQSVIHGGCKYGCLLEVAGHADVRRGQPLLLPALVVLGGVHSVHLGVVMVTMLHRGSGGYLWVLDVRVRHRQRRAFNIQTDGRNDGGCGGKDEVGESIG